MAGAEGGARSTDFRFVHRLDRIQMLGRGKPSRAHVIRVGTKRPLDLTVELRVAPHESRTNVADEAAQNVVRDDELAVDVRAGANAVDEQLHPFTYVRGRLG